MGFSIIGLGYGHCVWLFEKYFSNPVTTSPGYKSLAKLKKVFVIPPATKLMVYDCDWSSKCRKVVEVF